MILLVLLGIGFIIFGLFYFDDSGLFGFGRRKWYEAELIDEVEDEVYDNIGGTKTRFFKAYEFEEDGEKKVVRSQRPLKRITNKVGRKTKILVDSKSRKAMDKQDVILYRTIAAIFVAVGILLIAGVVYIKLNVKGAVL
ncbi:MAG: hypothetical protein IJO83_01935 [Clostridia bacterium]|nr:hypothetical protein [Clostridia bacterium]